MITNRFHAVAARRFLATGVLVVAATVTACEDDPVDTDAHDEGDVAGFVIERLLDGAGRDTIYTYSGPTNTDTLYLPAGESIDIEIVWTDDHGDAIDLDADEHDWELTENSSAILTFTRSDTETWQGTIVTAPLVAGATVFGVFDVTLFHGEEAEFETPQLDVAVEGD